MSETIPGLVRDAARRFGAREALVDGDVRLTYAQLAEQVELVARGLIACGVEPGDRVCVWAPNTRHWVIAALAAQSAGAALVPLNTRFLGAEALDVLARTRSRALFAPDAFLGRDPLALLRDAAEGELATALPALDTIVRIPLEGPRDDAGIAWDELLARAEQVPAETARERAAAVGPDDVADILFTSGTTGRPKGAMSSHRQTLAVAEAWAAHGEVGADDRYLVISPFFHSFGYKAGFVVCFLHGACVVPALTFDVEETLAAIERERITIVPGPPTIFQTLLAHPRRDEHELSSLRLAVTGSAMVPVALVERMRDELTFDAVLTAYGLTEAVVATMCHGDDAPETISRTAGVATAGFELRIADAEGRPLPAGEDGEVQLRGPNTMLGYLDDPAATAAAIDADGWLRTGDVGHVDERGYLTITDRLKDMFTVGGFNVYPAEIENELARLEEVVAGAVVGVPDERLGEVGAAYLIGTPGHALTEEGVIAHCRARLANYKVPRRVVFVEELPRNAAGKVLKQELRRQALAAR
ncbi:FadD3 family acyl-CoA ligase [Conexibacter sp. JD483]|uniref:FadD3 family acyl-CoA ligase n=1 Tax=unclassified Conexibacter TaxID=2627773 RepID=UPI0027176774|nr:MULTISPECIES: FadD3 family acyl-CoA ligase [unclassified Conexibacter]MDO8186815.1 FadD3 family acyl-CoA ligase [Conexibacter sp. CPCC 205706]MDO8197431.1 FadD3 family acyl-CoA ligase [Conexibacter sp. CPCC 205762]MDR9371247.1 FadD3 family acyl-CoA ligase [Conexibacter sp. JD483]